MYFRPKLDKDLETEWKTLVGIAREHGPDEVVDRFLRTLNSRKEQLQISADYVIRSESERIKTLEQLLEAGEVDLDQFEVTRYLTNKYDQHSVEKGLVELYQVKAWLNKKYLDEPSNEYYQKWLDRLGKDVKPFKHIIDSSSSADAPIIVAIADLHLGAILTKTHLVPDYNVAKCREKLHYIAQVINETGSPVHIKFLGDYIESFTGKNHKDTWKQIEKHGMEVSLEAFDVINEFLGKVNRLIDVEMVSGNHDRVTSDNQDDKDGQVAYLIYELLRRFTNVPVKYDTDILSSVHDGVCYIISHGHKKLSKMQPSELIMQYGKQGMFNVLLTGHGHEELILHNSANYQCRQVPPIVPPNEFATSLGKSSMQGFTIVKSNKYSKKVDVSTVSV